MGCGDVSSQFTELRIFNCGQSSRAILFQKAALLDIWYTRYSNQSSRRFLEFSFAFSNMPITIKILGTINVGSGTQFHTEYKLDITINDKRWILYRRYSAFEDLHTKLLVDPGEEIMTVSFPEKIYVGSYFSTVKQITADRHSKLQQYLDAIIIVEEITDSKAFSDFLDCDHLGLSGVIKELGAERVLKEGFIRTRITKNLPGILGVWSTNFVVLLSSGSIVVVNSVYDDSSKAICRMALVNGQTTVTPTATNNMIAIESKLDKTKLCFCFSTPEESVFWLRKISDFVLNTAYTEDYLKKEAQTKQSEHTRAQREKEVYVTSKQEHIHAKGTGRTNDDLSAMVGI